ncbi:hypothetical protein GJW-30_1_02685 [Variibacter gotjawalensis]|uniref:DUF2306 domain-containing protein n=1 Tax=Variibacter gotjawalensis TaxID=1333996 RepID=A0A0S3PW41_9BRAD|nr:hypothetical protein [Variibacter gotjawalensis]NIK45975.1 magnesium-transporting ATPase (P-type) [Variibacter gotjawalensis]RZS47893.1 hypothetical protein EV661_0288 [Variibacter gotjawalensis]BAT60149.1 hypothetical protein GJW-30_1_02685 [Variibacter gotjawalensis]
MSLDFTPFTWFHTILSLVALVAGFPVLRRLLASQMPPLWTGVFLITSILTCLTGFGFPFDKLLPSHYTGIITLGVIALALIARYVFHLRGGWRGIYAAAIVLAFYFNVFVFVVQLFQKVTALRALAPTQSEPPFAIAQIAVLAVFAYLTYRSARTFRPAV